MNKVPQMDRLQDITKKSVWGLRATTVSLAAFFIPFIAAIVILIKERKNALVLKAAQQSLLLYTITCVCDIFFLWVMSILPADFAGPALFFIVTITFWFVILLGYSLYKAASEEPLAMPIVTKLSNRIFKNFNSKLHIADSPKEIVQPMQSREDKRNTGKGAKKNTKKR